MRNKIKLLAGEMPIDNAPVIPISQHENCIPQHYLKFQHSQETVETLVLDMHFSERFPIFVGQENGQLFLQVGVIGVDNYQSASSDNAEKVVFGRKWRVEPLLPTSEIIQTAFLAVQKAREHEVRELFRVRESNQVTTPFNNHHDLPLMAQSRDWEPCRQVSVERTSPSADINRWLKSIQYDHATLSFQKLVQLAPSSWAVSFRITPDESTRLPELAHRDEFILLDALNQNTLYFAVMDKFLAMSNEYVEKHFTFKGFNRFSREHSVVAIGQLSAKTRERESRKIADSFSQTYSDTHYEVDKSRVPKLSDSPLSQKIRHQLTRLNVELEPMPK